MREAMADLSRAHEEHDQLGRLLQEIEELNFEAEKGRTPISDYLVVDRSNRNYGQRLVIRTGILPYQQPLIFLYENE